MGEILLAETSLGDAMRASAAADAVGLAAGHDPQTEVENAINAAQPPGSAPLRVASLELHLIRGLNRVDLGKGPVELVAFPPEFLYLADVGREARAGVSVFWDNGEGLGDPAFPDFTKAKIRSVAGASASNLIYPAVAGQLILGLVQGSDPVAGERDLEAQGLYDVALNGTFGEARCNLFDERSIAAGLPAAVPVLRYAEINWVVRMVDLDPGWDVRRIA